jgi:hypothetical protein
MSKFILDTEMHHHILLSKTTWKYYASVTCTAFILLLESQYFVNYRDYLLGVIQQDVIWSRQLVDKGFFIMDWNNNYRSSKRNNITKKNTQDKKPEEKIKKYTASSKIQPSERHSIREISPQDPQDPPSPHLQLIPLAFALTIALELGQIRQITHRLIL